MARRLSFLAVEGQHDAAFIGRLLKDAGFTLVQRMAQPAGTMRGQFLEPNLARLVPTQFPYDNDLLARVPVPFFWQTDSHAIALRPANSDSKLIGSAAAAIKAVGPDFFEAVGIILDADNKGNPLQRLAALQRSLKSEVVKNKNQPVGFSLPAQLAVVNGGKPRVGVFVMPDNGKAGTLEDLLLDCAGVNYSDLRKTAGNYLTKVRSAKLTSADLAEINAPSGPKKAQIGAMAAILKPGKAIQNSISDNRWLDGAAKTTPSVAGLRKFLQDLLNEPAI